MTLGEYPDGVPKKYVIPLGPFRSDGGVGRLENVAGRVGLSARGPNMSGGIIVNDFNGDGLLDVFYSTRDAAQGCALFVNRGDGTFEDRSAQAGLASQVGALNCNHADYDNDGDLDILLLRGGWDLARRPSLLRNEGDGRFTDVTVAAGLCEPIASQAGAWATSTTTVMSTCTSPASSSPRTPTRATGGGSTATTATAPSPMSPTRPASAMSAMARASPGATTTTTAGPTCTSRT